MKKLLLALLALLQAGAAPASVLVVDNPVTNAGRQFQNEKVRQAVMGIMTGRNVNLLRQPSTAVTTALVRNGQVVANGETIEKDVIVQTGFSTANAVSATYDPTSYLHYDNWPSKVMVFISEPYECSMLNVGADTTGVEGCNATSYGSGSMYTTTGPWVWKNREAVPIHAVTKVGTQHGVWEAILGYRVTPATNSFQVKDADSLGRKTKATEDSVLVWVRRRTATDSVALIFCQMGPSNRANISAIKAALKVADGYSRGKVFEDRARTTKKHSLVVVNANQHGNPPGTVTLNNNGIYCPSDNINADTCDFKNTRAGRDSLRALGIPYDLGIDADSTQAPFALTAQAMWMEDPNAKFLLQPMSGTYVGSRTTAAAAGQCRDPLGIQREREYWPLTPVSLGASCATDTGSIFCGISNGFTRLRAAVGSDRVIPVLLPSMWDWTPKSWTSAGAGAMRSDGAGGLKLWGGSDTLATVLFAAGVRAILTNPTLHTSNVGMRLSFNAGATGAQTAPAGWVPGARPLNVVWEGRRIASLPMLLTRWEPSYPWTWFDGHDITSEYLAGAELGDYYPVPSNAYWSHVFQLPTNVIAIPANSLGGPWGNPWPQMNGFRAVKWLVHSMRACDEYLYPWPDGTPKQLDTWVHVDQQIPVRGGVYQ